ncbi:SgcJ/EcaC family oxidoreductase [Paenibacillus chitinolyticus]|uniref:SgcJ/EcaC family oxidoreductase n=1 Tax=Paenibacillus chitinolyticus TaxID=79263 RepID=UPI0036648753
MTNQQDHMKAIGALFAKLSDAWNEGNGELFGSCFMEDADYVTFMGQHLKGRKQISDVHQMLFAGPLNGSVMVSSATVDLQPRFITPDVAVVHAIGEVQLAASEHAAPDNRGSINTNVVVKQNGEWKLTAFHNCRIQEMPRGAQE